MFVGCFLSLILLCRVASMFRLTYFCIFISAGEFVDLDLFVCLIDCFVCFVLFCFVWLVGWLVGWLVWLVVLIYSMFCSLLSVS